MKTQKFKFKKFIYALAPMAGVTDFAFRKVCADFGADMVLKLLNIIINAHKKCCKKIQLA